MNTASARLARLADRYALAAGMVALTAATLRMLARFGPAFHEWFSWADQGHYLASAQAWARGDLDASLHHYPPGYSLMAAPFVWLLPAQPFALPDLTCLLACLALFAALGRRLLPAAPGWRAASVAAFCVATVSSQILRQIWIVPWNTTGAAPFALGALLATFRLCEAPGSGRAAALGLLLGILAGIRPTDAAILAPCCVAYALLRLRHAGLRRLAPLAGAGILAILCGAAPLALAHVAVHGLSGGDYLAKSANIGFEWRLLPLRWVTLVLDPHPLLPEGRGLAEGLPWIGPGIAGLLFLTLVPAGDGRPWWLIGGAMLLHWCLYLSYRDLQPYGLWRFFNLHYFKWTFPFLVLAALRLGAALAAGPYRARAALAIGVTLLMLLWQPVGEVAAQGLELSPNGILQAVFLPLSGSWRDVYFGAATLTTGGKVYRNTWDFKLQPVAGGALLQPLRPMPEGMMTFQPASGTSLDAEGTARLSETLRFGVPCAILPRRAECRTPNYAAPLRR